MKNRQLTISNTIIETKNTLERTNRRKTEAKEWISELEGGMMEITEQRRIKKKLSGAALDISDKMEAWPQTSLFIPQAWSQDEGIRPCNSDLFFPLLSCVNEKEY